MQPDRSIERKRILKIYTIVQKPGEQRDIWLEIGVAVENRDGSLNAKLDALPVNGAIHVREYSPRRHEDARSNGNQQPSQGRWKEVRNEKVQ